MKKYFIAILIFLFFLIQVNAVVVQDIQSQIETGNQQVMQSNAQLLAQVKIIETQITELTKQIQDLKTSSVQKSDLPQIYFNIQQLQRDANGQQLATLLAVVAFTFAFLFLSKAKGWF